MSLVDAAASSPDGGLKMTARRSFNPRRREDLSWNGKGETDADGKRTGRWDFPFTDGAKCFLTYDGDELEGAFTYWHPDGRIEVGAFRESRRSGQAHVYVGDRVIRVEEWRDGELNGLMRIVDPDTNEIRLCCFAAGELHGEDKTVVDGITVSSRVWDHGELVSETPARDAE